LVTLRECHTVNLNNSTGSDDVDSSDATGAALSTTVNLNNAAGMDDETSLCEDRVDAAPPVHPASI
jgi:hypothetical protein